MITFQEVDKIIGKSGKIIIKKAGPIANAFRRVLLDEIETIRFNTDKTEIISDDDYMTLQVLMDLALVHLYEEGEFHINVKNKGSMPVEIMSDLIMNTTTGNPAKVEKGVFIYTLEPGRKLEIKKIFSERGIGRTHAKFSPVISSISYKPLDVIHVHYLSDNGFIENNRKCIRLTKDLDINKEYIIWNKIGEKNISEKDLKYSKNFIKIPAGQVTILKSELDDSDDFCVEFQAYFPTETFKAAVKVIDEGLDSKILTLTVGELIRSYIFREIPECPVFAEFGMIDENYYNIDIDHPSAEQILKKVKDIIRNILKNIKYL